MQFGYFTLSDNHYENNSRTSSVCAARNGARATDV
jgi:hypothetical protein